MWVCTRRALTYQGACRRLQEGVGFTPARARGDVNWYTSSPTVPMSYLLGRLELERLHAHLVTGEGWDLRRFNDWILSFGAIPWAGSGRLAWRAEAASSGALAPCQRRAMLVWCMPMSVEVKIPAVGESITSGLLSSWSKQDGDSG